MVTTFWVLLFVLILVAALSALAALLGRDEVREFSNTWGNYASVLGLWFGLIAFLLTILTLLLTAPGSTQTLTVAQTGIGAVSSVNHYASGRYSKAWRFSSSIAIRKARKHGSVWVSQGS